MTDRASSYSNARSSRRSASGIRRRILPALMDRDAVFTVVDLRLWRAGGNVARQSIYACNNFIVDPGKIDAEVHLAA